jgi:hypothetical protein
MKMNRLKQQKNGFFINCENLFKQIFQAVCRKGIDWECNLIGQRLSSLVSGSEIFGGNKMDPEKTQLNMDIDLATRKKLTH